MWHLFANHFSLLYLFILKVRLQRSKILWTLNMSTKDFFLLNQQQGQGHILLLACAFSRRFIILDLRKIFSVDEIKYLYLIYTFLTITLRRNGQNQIYYNVPNFDSYKLEIRLLSSIIFFSLAQLASSQNVAGEQVEKRKTRQICLTSDADMRKWWQGETKQAIINYKLTFTMVFRKGHNCAVARIRENPEFHIPLASSQSMNK